MTERPSRSVVSSQAEVHRDLEGRVAKHLSHVWHRPIAEHTRAAFEAVRDRVEAHPGALILDSGCGTGASSRALAAAQPDALVLGVDKSAARLARSAVAETPDNLLLVQADLQDFWRLAALAGWRPRRHLLLYPNPWPKPGHLGRRWHGHPVFPTLLALGGEIELRSNWRLYVDEFALALRIGGRESRIDRVPPESAVTPFEIKYLRSGQRCFRLLSPVPAS